MITNQEQGVMCMLVCWRGCWTFNISLHLEVYAPNEMVIFSLHCTNYFQLQEPLASFKMTGAQNAKIVTLIF